MIKNKTCTFLEFLHGKLLVKERFEKGCGFECDDNLNILCLSCEKYIWHAGCLKELENELDIDFKMTVDEKKKQLTNVLNVLYETTKCQDTQEF